MMTREQLEACPRFGEHGLIEGCVLCDPSKVPMPVAVSEQDRIALTALGAEVDAALALTERRAEVERMQQVNDAALVRLAQTQGIGVDKASILSVRLTVLVEMLFGDMDAARRLDYEHAVQAKFTELIADIQTQAARAKLLNGVRLDRPPTP